ncbi:MAG TPA: POTRA domain-containing protein [Chitinophagaceae bacterium]|nr:POTRA domain-containing protein [Chitinophagaceae bacterium]
MQRILRRICLLLTVVLTSLIGVYSQEPVDTTKPTSVDPNLIAWRDATRPKEYTISKIKITGVFFLDSAIVASIAGLQVGDKILHPGGDQFPKAIQNLWRQRLFSNVEIFVTRVSGDDIDIEINIMERPRLGNYYFHGIKKSEQEELVGKIGLAKQTIVTENTRRTADETIKKYYAEKGYLNLKLEIIEKPDTNFVNSVSLTFNIDKGQKVKVNDINFFGNEAISDLKLKKKLKGTKEVSRLTLFPKKDSTLFGENPKITFKEYRKDKGYLSVTKTKNFLDPYFRFKLFSSAKFNEKKFEEDKQRIIEYYNSIGYRDAIIEDVKPYSVSSGNINIDFKLSEGHKYYFGNITWKGNSKYSDSVLNVLLGIRKGDVYNIETLNQRLGKQVTPEGGDISGLYMDDGYLFFRAEAVETAVYNDTIDHEIRMIEGPQARIKNIKIYGNDRTKEHVIRRELRTIPGELFSRSDLIRSQRELGQLNYFNQETIGINPLPNPDDGTVDIHYKLEEKSSDQLELSAGWGGGIGLTGTVGVSFNNFSIKNIFNKKAWDPLPTGDGQKLSLRLQSNGKQYSSYNFSFTEPWLGGKKRNSLTLAFYKSKYANGYDYTTNRFSDEIARNSYMKTTGFSISLGKQLKWPDDFFSLIHTVSFTQYNMKNYPVFPGLDSGLSTNVSYKLTLQRNSAGPNPIFPTSGSNFLASVQFTPPYSLFNENIEIDNSYRHPEYHKWRFNAEWYVPLGKPMGAEKNRQFIVKLAAKYGFMGKYNRHLEISPFERFQLGDAGMSNSFGVLGYDIIAHRGYPIYQNSNPSINPDNDVSQASRFFTIFNKYQLELRYPFTTNPQSTIYGLAFFEAANGWYSFKEYNPFRLRRSAGVGMRFFLPMFGLLGFDYGIGIDRIKPGQGLKSASKFTFMLGYEPE